MSFHQTDAQRIERLEEELRSLGRRGRVFRWVALVALAGLGLSLATIGEAGGGRRLLRLVDPDSGAEAVLTAQSLSFSVNGQKRLELAVNDSWSGLSVFGEDDGIAVLVGTEEQSGSSVKLFSPQQKKLRVELSERLTDAGSGLRLYDRMGFPRATLYAERRGEVGLELTDANRQPRIDIFAKADGVSAFRANDGMATSVVELGVIPESDITLRYTGMYDEDRSSDPLLPMLYMTDPQGKHLIEMPVTPWE
ncbi:MAG: hypothetical protein HN348_07875 [Proteobacteria bacterium]|nr:hypothetical protein [Pseudomonadota bacterium]